MEMYLEHAPRGSPAFSILNPNGMFLADSGEGDQNVGFPNNPDQVDQYVAALRTACSKITDEDIKILRDKLEQMRIIPPE